MSDKIYTNLTKEVSVHLSDWPKVEFDVDKKLEENMQIIRDIAEKAHAQRKENEIPVRQPLMSLSSSHKNPGKQLEEILKEEINVKTIVWEKSKSEALLDTNITPELKEEAETRNLIREIQKERKKMGVSLTQGVIVKNPWLPEKKELREKIKEITLTEKLEKGDFEVTKAS
jgi:hypothetical protein